MSFVQVIEFRTSDIDSFMKTGEEWEQATAGKRTARRQIVTQDHHDPDRYLMMVFFDSYESAMENSQLPETQAIAERMMALADGPPVFHDLEVLEDRSL
jgi:hypothetical protein